MDLVLTTVFAIGAILAVAGALLAAIAPGAAWRVLGLLAVAVGTTAALLGLSAVFAAVVALVSLTASAIMLGGAESSLRLAGRAGVAAADEARSRRPYLAGQVAAAASALLFVGLVVVAARGAFVAGAGAGAFDLAALGRLFFGRDALAVEAAGAALLAALAVGAIGRSWRP